MVARVSLWSMIVSFPGHTHFLTFRSHLALTFTFVGLALHSLIDLSVGSVNKTTKLFADINIPLSTIVS